MAGSVRVGWRSTGKLGNDKAKGEHRHQQAQQHPEEDMKIRKEEEGKRSGTTKLNSKTTSHAHTHNPRESHVRTHLALVAPAAMLSLSSPGPLLLLALPAAHPAAAARAVQRAQLVALFLGGQRRGECS